MHLSYGNLLLDVRKALSQMNPRKSSEKDGLGSVFYQKFCNVVDADVCSTCLSFLNGSGDISFIYETIITLIPKVKTPTLTSDFRPISLCNVLYKIIAKILSNRLQEILDKAISEEQNAFILGRLITDNAMVNFECLNTIKRHKKGKEGFLPLKADMAKAYDRVSGDFYMLYMMLKMGFSPEWVNIICKCISSVTYTIYLNGGLALKFPNRDLRQGDPLSPFLFLICAEGLSSLVNYELQNGTISGLPCGRTGPIVSPYLSLTTVSSF